MKFKAKIRKIGNSMGVIIPKDVITDFVLGEEIELDVITIKQKSNNVITRKKLIFNTKTGVEEWQ